MTLDQQILREAHQIRDRLLELRHESERAQTDLHHSIRRLHVSGGSLREIADSLGLSHQRVHQIVDGERAERPRRRRLGRPRPARRAKRPFERFSAAAKAVVERAQDEARTLRHQYVGTEHFLLALTGEQSLQRVFSELGGHARVQELVRSIIGEGSEASPGPVPLTPRSKRALQRAANEAGEDDVEPVHLLLALARERKGVAAQILVELGCGGEDAIRAALAA
jgi:hypothetical protein